MKLIALTISDQPPIKSFSVSDLADIVVIAGPNGVGKTNILNLILGTFRNPGSDSRVMIAVEATTDSEKQAWGGRDRLDTSVPEEAGLLRQFLQRSHKRGQM